MSELIEMLSFPLMQRAIIVGALVALCASLLGVSLVLKRYSMIGDGLSHVGFGALALAAVLNASPLVVAIPIVIVVAFLLLRIKDTAKLKGDAAIAVISTGALAAGVLLVSLGNSNVDLMNYMFGSILAMKTSDVWLSVVLSIAVLAVYIILYGKIFAITFDETFAKATGVRAGLYNSILAVLTAVTVVLGMRLMGALLISSLIIFPPLTSMRVFNSFRKVVISSAVVSVLSLVTGIILSYFYSLPTGACIVCVNIVVLCVFSVVGAIGRKRVK